MNNAPCEGSSSWVALLDATLTTEQLSKLLDLRRMELPTQTQCYTALLHEPLSLWVTQDSSHIPKLVSLVLLYEEVDFESWQVALLVPDGTHPLDQEKIEAWTESLELSGR